MGPFNVVISYSLSRGGSLLRFPWFGLLSAPLRHPRAKWSLEPQWKQWSQNSWFAVWHAGQTRLLWFSNGCLEWTLSLSLVFWEAIASFKTAISDWTASRVAINLSGLSDFASFFDPGFLGWIWPPGSSCSPSTSKQLEVAVLRALNPSSFFLLPHKLNVLKDQAQPTIYRHFFDRHSFNPFASITVCTQKTNANIGWTPHENFFYPTIPVINNTIWLLTLFFQTNVHFIRMLAAGR